MIKLDDGEEPRGAPLHYYQKNETNDHTSLPLNEENDNEQTKRNHRQMELKREFFPIRHGSPCFMGYHAVILWNTFIMNIATVHGSAVLSPTVKHQEHGVWGIPHPVLSDRRRKCPIYVVSEITNV
eukprot:gene26545-biopygen3923